MHSLDNALIPGEDFRRLLRQINDGLKNPTNKAATCLARIALQTLTEYDPQTILNYKQQIGYNG